MLEQSSFSPEILDDWDPLQEEKTDPGLLIAAQRREIRNILKSYTGSYDLFSELFQNALDAVERRSLEGVHTYKPSIWIKIDMVASSVSVTDNGCGMDLAQFQQFMRPNFSFKDGNFSRGSKGVGATYLAYGFNYLEVATRVDGKTFAGVLKNGREWLEDKTGTLGRPRVTRTDVVHSAFASIDRGTSLTLKLTGNQIRPKNLKYNGAFTAQQWIKVLQVVTPMGGVYICGEKSPSISIYLEVVHPTTGEITHAYIERPEYIYPHTVMGQTADLREYLADQLHRSQRGLDISKIPPKFTRLNSLWGEWSGEEIINDKSPVKLQLDPEERDLISELDLKIYAFLGFSTELWDEYNDVKLGLRKGMRLLRGGIQLATRNMPQGTPITIPVSRSIFFQNIVHIIVHFNNAEPDLGRKGFQPEHVRIAERLATSTVAAFVKHYSLLRVKTGVPALQQQMQLSQWIDVQRKHEQEYPLVIRGKGLFLPTEELPIRSMPLVEQDVVALFNQMLSSGIIRGVQILSSSQYKQYDGLYRILMQPPFDKYIRGENNPLGIDPGIFTGVIDSLETPVQILEYKYNIDALIEEFQTEEKNPDDIKLVVAWDIGIKWQGLFDVTSYLDDDNVHHRQFHGFTHSFYHSASHTHAFEAIVLNDLIHYLLNPEEEVKNQRKKFSEDLGL